MYRSRIVWLILLKMSFRFLEKIKVNQQQMWILGWTVPLRDVRVILGHRHWVAGWGSDLYMCGGVVSSSCLCAQLIHSQTVIWHSRAAWTKKNPKPSFCWRVIEFSSLLTDKLQTVRYDIIQSDFRGRHMFWHTSHLNQPLKHVR